MPPPPFKRIKRPPKVLDEDEYTAALSDIIARDYFPGLLESQAQHEYLAALESGNDAWIAEAAQKLRTAGGPANTKRRSTTAARNTRFDNNSHSHGHKGHTTPSATPLLSRTTPTATRGGGVADTPVGYNAGSETPAGIRSESKEGGLGQGQDEDGGLLDTSGLSLGAFQAKYTSEDNESFNALLDKQNRKRREKHAYMWTQDQRVPSARLLAYRQHQARRSLEEKAEGGKTDGQEGAAAALAVTTTTTGGAAKKEEGGGGAENNKTALDVVVGPSSPMTVGATDARPARPDAWRIRRPDNSFMFPATSVDEDTPGLPTVQEAKEQMSKIGPKHVVHANTRFPPVSYIDDEPGPIPPSPSLNTEIIARRDAITKRKNKNNSNASFAPSESGGETPRVNGYAFVDEDEPENIEEPTQTRPSYRDLLAGQFDGDSTPNPFKIGDIRKREELHLRMLDRQAKQKRDKERDTTLRPAGLTGNNGNGNGSMTTPAAAAAAGNMTPAARRLMEKLGGGRTLVRTAGPSDDRSGTAVHKDMWTPVRTPRRKK